MIDLWPWRVQKIAFGDMFTHWKSYFFLIKVSSFGRKGHSVLEVFTRSSLVQNWTNLVGQFDSQSVSWEFRDLSQFWLESVGFYSLVNLKNINNFKKILIILAWGQLQGSKWVWNKSSKKALTDFFGLLISSPSITCHFEGQNWCIDISLIWYQSGFSGLLSIQWQLVKYFRLHLLKVEYVNSIQSVIK